MRTLFLVAAMAAVAVPSSASARHDNHRHYRHGHAKHRHVTYVAPYRSWSYRPVTVGSQLRSAFYGSRYYIDDYGSYGVRAPARYYQRWIRYGDDLLLVNVRTGRVLAVRHYSYW